MELPEGFTHRMFFNSFLPFHESKTVEEKLQELLPWVNAEILAKIDWLGMFSDVALPKTNGSPASILEEILKDKWKLDQGDKDMIVMQHLFEIDTPEGKKETVASLVCKGENQEYTAMAKTVGLPLAIAVDLFLEGKINLRGLQVPVLPEIYEPILEALVKEGIEFEEDSRLI
jgi:saccharopine dehydrogenase (NADP+, L-glutamate forming)